MGTKAEIGNGSTSLYSYLTIRFGALFISIQDSVSQGCNNIGGRAVLPKGKNDMHKIKTFIFRLCQTND